MIVAIGFVMFYALGQINREVIKSNSVGRLVKDIFELNIVTNEYVMHHEKRMQDQWNIKYNSLYSELEVIRKMPLPPEHHFIIESIITDYNALGELFTQLVENYKQQAETDMHIRIEKILTN